MPKPQQTLADYLAIAICPVLIMALVGSLVFFLAEVLYQGNYGGRLLWVLFFFVFAAVLIARMSMLGPGLADRAPLYGLALAVVVWLALWRFVEFGPDTVLAAFSWAINPILMAIIWWCAHRLTWDCTLIDDDVDASGAGLLEVAGLDKAEGQEPEIGVSGQGSGGREEEASSSSLTPGLLGWWDRYRQYREEQLRRPHAPGVWVVYFSLAALPLFGLGQSLIPAEDEERRRYVFWLLGIYVASGLGLLLTTSFLGLRRYLRQRKLHMPPAMTGVWLTMGCLLIGALLLAGAFLPRPNAEYPLVNLPSLTGSRDREASRYAMKGGDAGKGEGSGGPSKTDKNGEQTSGSGQKSSGSSSNDSKDSSGQSGQQSSQGKGNDQNQSGDGRGADRSGKDTGKESGQDSGKGKNNSTDKQGSGSKSSDSSGSKPPVSKSSFSLAGLLKTLATILKWVVFAVLAVVVAVYLLRFGLKFLANFTAWARNLLAALDRLLQALFGRRGDSAASREGVEEEAGKERRPFASFRNPFWDGGEHLHSPEELVRYSFEALEALAWERGLPRPPEETPLEFASRLGDDLPGLDAEAKRLAALYARVAYARGRLPLSSVDMVRKFWQKLGDVVESPLSAR
jgi:hypothetical protein